MTSEALLKAIGAADDAVLLRCERPARRPYIYIAVAACAVLAITVGLLTPRLAPDTPSLPVENSSATTTAVTTTVAPTTIDTTAAPTTTTATTAATTAAPTTATATTTTAKPPTKTSSIQIPLRAACLTDAITPSEWVNVPDTDHRMATLLSEFSVSLLKNSYSGSGNHVTAPLTAYTALSMLYNGADGTTAAQMQQVLGASPAFINERLGSLLRGLRTDTENSLLQTANSLWLKEGDRVSAAFLQSVVDAYDAAVYSDNISINEINEWVSEKTQGRIPELLESSLPTAEMYLVTAQIYSARWQCTGSQTKLMFTQKDGSVVEADGIQLDKDSVSAAYISEYYTTVVCAMENAYMLIIMPHEGTLPDLLSGLRGQDLLDASAHGGTLHKCVEVILPQFSVRSKGDLRTTLSQMGMPEIFSAQKADFRKMGYAIGSLAVAGVATETTFSVGEKGIDAASAMAIFPTMAGVDSEEPVRVTIDRPFFYAVVDSKSQIPLYVGVQDSVS